MGVHIAKARRCVERIQYYHRHGGVYGYKQAKYRWFELDDLMTKADNSKKDKGDVVVIQILKESVRELIEEMRKRAGVKE